MFKKLREEKEAAPPAKKKKSKGKKKKTPYSDLHTEQKKTKQSKKVKPASAYEAQAADEMAEGPNGMFKGKTIKEVSPLCGILHPQYTAIAVVSFYSGSQKYVSCPHRIERAAR